MSVLVSGVSGVVGRRLVPPSRNPLPALLLRDWIAVIANH
jgi:hypothetical protein